MDSKWLNKLERHVRQISDMQVPVYAATEKGAEIMAAKLRELGREPDDILESSPEPLI